MEFVVSAITDILLNASDGGQISLVIPKQALKGKVPCQPSQC